MQWETFRQGDIFLGDKGFCSYFDIAHLEKQGVDSVVTLARRKPVNKCQTPEMIRKEILMHFISYNCIRRLMFEAAEKIEMAVRLVSFKGSLQAIRNWEPHLNHERVSKAERFKLLNDLYVAMTNCPIKQRPGRSEPRCLKRRPKNYQLLTSPRHEMKEMKHRSRYRAANA